MLCSNFTGTLVKLFHNCSWKLQLHWVKKGCHPNHGYNFVNSRWICKFFSPLQRVVNLQQIQY